MCQLLVSRKRCLDGSNLTFRIPSPALVPAYRVGLFQTNKAELLTTWTRHLFTIRFVLKKHTAFWTRTDCRTVFDPNYLFFRTVLDNPESGVLACTVKVAAFPYTGCPPGLQAIPAEIITLLLSFLGTNWTDHSFVPFALSLTKGTTSRTFLYSNSFP